MVSMRIVELWRYPVKSLRGERVDALELTAAGVAGDRQLAFSSTAAPIGKPLLHSRERTRALLHDGVAVSLDGERQQAATRAIAEPGAVLTLLRSDRPLTDVRPIALHALDDLADIAATFGDTIDGRRFRSNIIAGTLDGVRTGDTLAVASGAVLRITERIPRCRIVSLSPETAEADARLLRHLATTRDGRFGWYAVVERAGTIRAGGRLLHSGHALLHSGDAIHSPDLHSTGVALARLQLTRPT